MITLKLVTEPQGLSEKEQEELITLHKLFLADRRDALKLRSEVPDVTVDTLLRNTKCLVAIRGGVIVGYVMFRNMMNDFSIRCLYVRPEHRMCGVMSSLLQHVLAKERFASGSCNVPPTSPHVRDFLTDRGWRLQKLNEWWCLTIRQLLPMTPA